MVNAGNVELSLILKIGTLIMIDHTARVEQQMLSMDKLFVQVATEKRQTLCYIHTLNFI
jgi:hypothetical protein